ncbi:MAG: tetratricopeptide repeat protein [Cryomorphaceae bacterium]|nr:tetratricopeptide repeat protein [Cryomorphaceae bacterium]
MRRFIIFTKTFILTIHFLAAQKNEIRESRSIDFQSGISSLLLDADARQKHDMPGAHLLLDSAYKLAQNANSIDDLVAVMNKKGLLFSKDRNYAEASKWFEGITKLPHSAPTSKADAFNRMGALSEYQDEIDQAIYYHQKAHDINKSIPERSVEATISKEKIAKCLMLKHNLQASDSLYGIVIDEFENIGALENKASALSGRGTVMRKAGKVNQALTYSYEALKILYEIDGDKTQIVGSHINIGNIYGSTGRIDNAKEHYLKAAAINEQVGDERKQAALYNNMAIIFRMKEDLDSAMIFALKASEYNELLKDKRAMGRTYETIGAIALGQKDFPAAEAYFLKSMKVRKEIGDHEGVLILNNNLGVLYVEIDEPEKARENFKSAINTAKKIGNKKVIQKYYENMSAFEALNGNFETALELFRIATFYNDTIQREEYGENVARLETEYQTLKKQREIELLSKEKSIQNLELQKRQAELNFAKVTNIEKEKSIALLELENENKQNQLKKSQLEIEKTSAELELSIAEKALREAELERMESVRRNYLMGTAFMLISLIAGVSFYSYRRKSKHTMAVISLENKLMRSQMKPHFLYNTLNSINHFIISNKNREASNLLIKFSKLIRSQLHNSIHDEVSLETEIQTLKTYMDLERETYENKFDFEISIPPDMDTEEILLPPLVIQPFLENAIIHGIKPLDNKGKITLSISKLDNFLKCEIVDNGVGRQRKKSIQPKEKKHESVGLSITESRLKLVNPKGQKIENIKFFDLPQGTKVEVLIPFKEGF